MAIITCYKFGDSGGVVRGGGGGEYLFVQKWKFQGEGGGGLREIPYVVGVWIFSRTTQLRQKIH